MADNYVANAGSGGATFASDDVAGIQYPRVKLAWGADGTAVDASSATPMPVAPQGTAAAFWPGYFAPSTTGPQPLAIDDYGALVTRGAVATDEGTFRVNFANTTLANPIGTVTVSGLIVTGTGFAGFTDVHAKDYFKLDADGETAWVQIDSVDSDTRITLVSSYVGGASGAASRALIRPATGAGGTIAVASGQCTMTSGTTVAAITRIVRNVDIAPVVFRARVSVSQRIANQIVRIGLSESLTVNDRWLARFRLEGVTNTTVICESGRNPTVTPSAAETESTTITMPNGATTAALNEYRVEMLTERVVFYVNGVAVATHTRSIPAQTDALEASVTIVNGGTAPASSTTVIADYVTCKNHNKLEIGVMSDTEQIVAASAPLAPFVYNVAGVIAINTDLLVVDCLQLRGLLIHCQSMGTTGNVTAQWSNTPDFAAPFGATLFDPVGGGSGGTFNASVLRSVNVYARYFRLRLTTATTAGTTTIVVQGSQSATAPPSPSQQVVASGTVTANIGTGSLAAGTNAIGDVGLQGRANATGAMSTAKILAAASTNATLIKASAGRVFGWQLTNTTAAVKVVRLYNLTVAPTVGTSVPAYVIVIPANGTVTASFPVGIAHATGISYSITNAIADLDATVTAANDVLGAIYWL